MAALNAKSHSLDPLSNRWPGAADAALLITSLRGAPFRVPEDIDREAWLDLVQKNGVLPLAPQSLLENGAEVPAFFANAAHEC
jgi:hypothetical protein